MINELDGVYEWDSLPICNILGWGLVLVCCMELMSWLI